MQRRRLAGNHRRAAEAQKDAVCVRRAMRGNHAELEMLLAELEDPQHVIAVGPGPALRRPMARRNLAKHQVAVHRDLAAKAGGDLLKGEIIPAVLRVVGPMPQRDGNQPVGGQVRRRLARKVRDPPLHPDFQVAQSDLLLGVVRQDNPLFHHRAIGGKGEAMLHVKPEQLPADRERRSPHPCRSVFEMIDQRWGDAGRRRAFTTVGRGQIDTWLVGHQAV